MMDTQMLSILLQAAIAIFTRHFQATGEVLTSDQVIAKLKEELSAGQNEITRWFIEKGLTPPK